MKLVILKNDLVGAEHVEPFAGGASVALSLLFEEFVSRVYINDINPGVFTFWKAVLEQPDELCDRILRARLTMREWRRQHDIQNRSATETVDDLDLALATFVLNRTNRSGIIDGGPIGGHNQTGGWKVNARYNAGSWPRGSARSPGSQIASASRAPMPRASLSPGPEVWQDAFIYLDPPYYTQGAHIYTDHYSHEDHVEIARLVRCLKSPGLVTHDAVPEIVELYQGHKRVEYSPATARRTEYSCREVMFFERSLSIPKLKSPTNISVEVVGQAKVRSFLGGSVNRTTRTAETTWNVPTHYR